MVERATRFLILARGKNGDTKAVVAFIIKQAKRLSASLRRTLTGASRAERQLQKIFHSHQRLCAFCDPLSP